MAKNKRRLSSKELNDLKRIEDLIESTKQPNKVALLQKAKETQQTTQSKNKEKVLNFGSVEIDTSKLIMTQHSLDRAKERFNMDNSTASKYFISRLSEASYIGIIDDEESEKQSHLFAVGRTAIHISLDLIHVLTVYKSEKVTYDPLKEKVLELHRKKFNRYSITEKAKQKRLHQIKLECDVEVSNLKLRIHKTKSPSVKMACEARILGIRQTINEYEREIVSIQTEKRRIARSMISVI
jgi:hypothetical protein